MAVRLYNGKRVLHTRKLSPTMIELTFPPAVAGGPRVKEVVSFDTYQKDKSVVETAPQAATIAVR